MNDYYKVISIMVIMLKVRIPGTRNQVGERFWIKKISERGNYVTGKLCNDLITRPCNFGDIIEIRKSWVLETVIE